MKTYNIKKSCLKIIVIIVMMSSFSFSKEEECVGGWLLNPGSFLYPTYIKSKIVNMDQFLGKWKGFGCKINIKSLKEGDRYLIEITEKDNGKEYDSSKFLGIFFKVKNNLFLDLTALPVEDPALFLTNIPGHLIVKIDLINQNKTQFVLMNYLEILSIRKKYPKLLQCHYFEDQSRMVILSTSKQIVQALQNKHFVEDFFSVKEKVILKKNKRKK